MCFSEGSQNRAFFRDLPAQSQRQAHVAAFLADIFGNRSAQPLFHIEHNWADYPYTRGAYAPYFPPGALSGFSETWRLLSSFNGSRAMRHLWLAGADYSQKSGGYIDGAIQSGTEAALRMLARAVDIGR